MVAALLAMLILSCGTGGGDSPNRTPGLTDISSSATATPSERALTRLDLPARVAVTLPVFEGFVRQAAGDHAEVFSIVPPGVDPRTYELTVQDIERLRGVKFFFVNGLGLDDHLRQAFEEYQDEGSYIVPFGPNVRSPTASGQYADEARDEAHLWLDPDLAAIYVAIVADEFAIYDEVNSSFYDGLFRESVAILKMLGSELASDVETIPDERRQIVASSEAVTHIARRLGLSVLATASGAGPGEASADTIQRLVSVVRREALPAVFGEIGYDNSLMEQVAVDAGVPLCMLHTDIDTGMSSGYADLMRDNAVELVNCLGS